MGSITGSPHKNEKTLDISVLTGVRPLIETMPLEKASDAYQRVKSGNIRFRMVLVMGEADHAPYWTGPHCLELKP
jgi:alcohol dehydrogenase